MRAFSPGLTSIKGRALAGRRAAPLPDPWVQLLAVAQGDPPSPLSEAAGAEGDPLPSFPLGFSALALPSAAAFFFFSGFGAGPSPWAGWAFLGFTFLGFTAANCKIGATGRISRGALRCTDAAPPTCLSKAFAVAGWTLPGPRQEMPSAVALGGPGKAGHFSLLISQPGREWEKAPPRRPSGHPGTGDEGYEKGSEPSGAWAETPPHPPAAGKQRVSRALWLRVQGAPPTLNLPVAPWAEELRGRTR